MDFDTFLKIAFVVGTIVSSILSYYAKWNTYLKYKDQRVGVRTKWWRK